MPLTPDIVTPASRIMLPAYVVLSAAYGIVYTFDPLDRLDRIHTLTYQRQVMHDSMLPWGLVFLGLAVLMVVAFGRRSRMTMAFGLCACAMTWLVWAGLYIASAVIDHEASILAPVLAVFVAVCCLASTVSLLRDEI